MNSFQNEIVKRLDEEVAPEELCKRALIGRSREEIHRRCGEGGGDGGGGEGGDSGGGSGSDSGSDDSGDDNGNLDGTQVASMEDIAVDILCGEYMRQFGALPPGGCNIFRKNPPAPAPAPPSAPPAAPKPAPPPSSAPAPAPAPKPPTRNAGSKPGQRVPK